MSTINFKWHKFDAAATIPSKRESDVGFDLYCLDTMVLLPHETKLFRTGLGCIIPSGYWLRIADRGSTGSKGIHVHAGIVDEQYVGEIFVALCNTNNFPVKFSKDVDKVTMVGDTLFYPLSKGIAQAIPEIRLDTKSMEADEKEWLKACGKSERGDTKLGQSGK